MFNMTKIRASNGAGKAFYLNHLSANDYYSEGEKIVGYWNGRLAMDFGLTASTVEMDVFSLLQQNINPKTMGKLTQRTVASGVRFFDFQCAAPKSVSVMMLLDPRLKEMHHKAVYRAMMELEKLAAARVRHGENTRTNNYEMTGKILYASFDHDTSRALDPQLHTHNVVANVTKTGDGKFKALESLEMIRAIRYAGKVYHNELAMLCRGLGYSTVNHYDEKGNIVWFDLEGVSQETMEMFSKRRTQIEAKEAEFIAEHGRKPTLAENNFISVSTRSDKLKDITTDEVVQFQKEQLSDDQLAELRRVFNKSRVFSMPEKKVTEQELAELVRRVIPLIYERESVVKLDKVLAETLNQNLGRIDLAMLKNVIRKMPELKNLGGLEANPYFSTQEVIDRELYAITAVENQRDLFEAVASDFEAFPGQENRRKQAELIHGLLSSKDRFNLFRGVAGAGKTSTLQEFCRGLRSGWIENIHLIAPTNSATDVLKQEGFEQSQTVASFLLSPNKPPAGSYVIIDESGLNSLREGVEIIKAARANNYRVLFVGDARQHTAVESGDFFRLLEDYSEIGKFSLTDIYRQQNEEYRRGIMECAMGQFEQAFERFDVNHFIHEGKAKYLDNAAQSYLDFTDNGRNIDQAILVAPTHDECDRLTNALRLKLKTHGSIEYTGRQTPIFRSWNKPKAWLQNEENYRPGTVVLLIRNMKGIGKAGETATVESVSNGMLHLDNGKNIYARKSADFIEVGELREIELCKGDLIQFNVNLREQKIYNGSIAQIIDDSGKVMMLYPDGKPHQLVDLPADYQAFKYGWVSTSHKSQGRTAENVVVAAQAMDRKAFYVALSRGRKFLALHCPEKDFLKQQLSFRTGERTSIHDLIRNREIPANALLPLSSEAREIKQKLLPDNGYKAIWERAAQFLRKVKDSFNKLFGHKSKVASRRARFRKYGYGLVTEKTYFEQDRLFAFDPAAAGKFAAEQNLSPGMNKLHELRDRFSGKTTQPASGGESTFNFHPIDEYAAPAKSEKIKLEILKEFRPETRKESISPLQELKPLSEFIPRKEAAKDSSEINPMSDSQVKMLDDLVTKGRLTEYSTQLTQREANELISRTINESPLETYQLEILQRRMKDGKVPLYTDAQLQNMTQKEYREVLKSISPSSPKPPAKDDKSKGMDL